MNDLDLRISSIVGKYVNDSKVSQEALSKKIGVSQPSLSRLLAGKKSWVVRDIEAMAAIGVDFSDLFTREV